MKNRINFYLFVFCASITSVFALNPYVYVRVPLKALTPQWVKQTDFIRDHAYDSRYAFGYVRAESLATSATDFPVDLLDEVLFRTRKIDFTTLLPLAEVSPEETGGAEPYHTYQTLTDELKGLEKAYPSLFSLSSAGKSVQGRELWLMKASGPNSAADKPKLLYVSSMHGDEVTGKELMVYFLRKLGKGYGKDPRVTSLLDQAEIYVMPSMNPDGTELRQRFNANGVDLNRNFPHMNEPAFSSADREPETKALMELHRYHQFEVAMNFHGGALCVNIPWDHRPNPAGSKDLFKYDAEMRMLAQRYAELNRPMYNVHYESFVHGVTYGYEWFQVLGGMQDWAAYFRDSIHATLEVSEVKWPPAAQLPQFWADNEEAMLSYLEEGIKVARGKAR